MCKSPLVFLQNRQNSLSICHIVTQAFRRPLQWTAPPIQSSIFWQPAVTLSSWPNIVRSKMPLILESYKRNFRQIETTWWINEKITKFQNESMPFCFCLFYIICFMVVLSALIRLMLCHQRKAPEKVLDRVGDMCH